MPTLVLTNFNIVCASIGGFISLFGLVSFLLKESFYLSEPLISLLAGVTLSPHALDWIRPLDYAQNVPENLDVITLYFTRLVLGVQLVIAGVQLPSQYLRVEWRPLALLLGPGMTIMWLVTSLLVWAMVPNFGFLPALAVAACVTPTDPVLSNSIVKGKFADKNIPGPLQSIILAESGANDGLGYPFLFLALYLIKYNGQDGFPGAGEAIRLWFGESWAYTILLSVAYGVAAGWIAKDLLHFCERRKYVDRESFLVFAITLALFIVGTCGMIGTDDVLACFVAGNVFTWDDWFRLETHDDSLQPTIDMLLNISVFAWFGAVAPWELFRTNDYIPIYRLIVLGILVLLLRRLPMVLAFYKFLPGILHQPRDWQQAFYTGYFGPIGVSAVFYLYVSVDFLTHIRVNGEVRPDCQALADVIRVVVWFLAICSIVVHGMSVPLGKFSYHAPRTLSQMITTERDEESLEPGRRVVRLPTEILNRYRAKKGMSMDTSPPPIFKLGELRPARTSVTDAKADVDLAVQIQSALEPPRPVVIIETPANSSPAHSVPPSPQQKPTVRFHGPQFSNERLERRISEVSEVSESSESSEATK